MSLALAVAAAWPFALRAQAPTFRSTVDVIAVDVQVTDHDGRPIPALAPGDFSVTIGGKHRRVASADFIRSTNLDGTALDPDDAVAARASIGLDPERAPGAGRTFVLAFDTESFTIGESRDAVAAAQGFVRRLQPNDRVGLYTFPIGPRIAPTLDHAAVLRGVGTIIGHMQNLPGGFNLSPSEIIDITAEMGRARANTTGRASTRPGALAGDVTRRVSARECATNDAQCEEEVQTEAQSLAFYLEGRATEGLNGLRALIRLLDTEPGRKTVVMFSAGMPITDRPGGRPDVGDLAKLLGQDAAATNTTIYVLHLDMGAWRQMSAETRRADDPPISTARDSSITSRLLAEFSGASGGALIRVLMGGGDVALARILRETSSHYLLGVEPDDSDRDGRLRDLRVNVARKGVTVRSRLWVVVPRRTT